MHLAFVNTVTTGKRKSKNGITSTHKNLRSAQEAKNPHSKDLAVSSKEATVRIKQCFHPLPLFQEDSHRQPPYTSPPTHL